MKNSRALLMVLGAGVVAMGVVAGMAVVPSLVHAEPVKIDEEGQTQLHLTATIRDFKAKGDKGGHPDFEAYMGTTRIGHVEDRLGPDAKPVFKSPYGIEIISEYKDKNGNFISPNLFNSSLGDVAGRLATKTDKKITSRESFDQWYRDVPGINVSRQLDITLNLDPDTGRYVFDSAIDQPFHDRGGFFPVNGELYGNYGETSKNYHFTTEVATEFDYTRGRGDVFQFTGDDDVWVFINGRLVIDLGSMHPKRVQQIELDRLAWLEDGARCTLHVFHAERHTVDSNFRIETTLKLRRVSPPETTGKYD